MDWREIYSAVGASPWALLALPVALMLPFWHARWRKQRKDREISGDVKEALSFLAMGIAYFFLAAVLISIADGMSGDGLEVIPIYLFKAGIPMFLLYMLFRQMIDAYF
jgi:hypothetical protein